MQRAKNSKPQLKTIHLYPQLKNIKLSSVRGALPLGIHPGRADLPVSGQVLFQPDFHLDEDCGAKRGRLSCSHFLPLQGPLQGGGAQGIMIFASVAGKK